METRGRLEPPCGLSWPLGLSEWVVPEDTRGSAPWNSDVVQGSQLFREVAGRAGLGFCSRRLEWQRSLNPRFRNVPLKFVWSAPNRHLFFSPAQRLNLQISAAGGVSSPEVPDFSNCVHSGLWTQHPLSHLVLLFLCFLKHELCWFFFLLLSAFTLASLGVLSQYPCELRKSVTSKGHRSYLVTTGWRAGLSIPGPSSQLPSHTVATLTMGPSAVYSPLRVFVFYFLKKFPWQKLKRVVFFFWRKLSYIYLFDLLS